jgi:hypothetical protein
VSTQDANDIDKSGDYRNHPRNTLFEEFSCQGTPTDVGGKASTHLDATLPPEYKCVLYACNLLQIHHLPLRVLLDLAFPEAANPYK